MVLGQSGSRREPIWEADPAPESGSQMFRRPPFGLRGPHEDPLQARPPARSQGIDLGSLRGRLFADPSPRSCARPFPTQDIGTSHLLRRLREATKALVPILVLLLDVGGTLEEERRGVLVAQREFMSAGADNVLVNRNTPEDVATIAAGEGLGSPPRGDARKTG